MKKDQVVKCVLSGSLAIVFTTVMACSQGGSSKHAEHAGSAEQTVAATEQPVFSDPKVKDVYAHYIHLKNALVSSDAKEAQSAAAALQTALKTAGSTKGADLAGKIASASALDAQRVQLNALTAEVEKVIRSSKITGGVVYKQHCPMANKGDGGYWLASEKAIKNPYYGDDMLTCGSVEEEIK